MKYKISESPLRLREYGRNIQSMVEFAKGIEDREARTKVAHEIVRIMSNLNPSLKEIPDYKQKLWDHIFMISNYNLDVDAPYPMPTPEELEEKARKRMDYYRKKPRYRQYGCNVELMIQRAVDMEEGPRKMAYINLIANTMKQFLRNMDRETTPESVIAEHIRDISGGRLQVKGEDLTIHKAVPAPPAHQKNYRSSNGKDSNKRHGRNRGNRNKRRRKN